MALRPDLYRRLQQRFGDVEIAREQEMMESSYGPTTDRVDRQGRPIRELEVSSPGEAYRINCPFCNDTRKRLWVNHMWGYRTEDEPFSTHMWLIHCFNEDCLKDFYRKKEFYKMVYDDVGYGNRPDDQLMPGVSLPREVHKTSAPGTMVRLIHLPPDHPACVYVRSRGYDPAELYAAARVCYCTEAKTEYALATGRLIVPVYKNGVLVGWQARYLGTPPNKYNPKYYTQPGFPKGCVLYNFDVARRCPYVVVTEGVFDAWRYGPEAVALLGNKATHVQGQLIINTWDKKVVVCLLDGEAVNENQALYDLISVYHPRVVRVDLPADKDPDGCSTNYLRQLVAQAAAAKGWDLS